jgi:hypothetical protein
MLELGVRIDEAQREAPRELPAERRLAGPGEADQKQIAPAKRHRGIGRRGGRNAAWGIAHRTDVTESFTMRGVRKMSSSVFSLLLPVCLKR